MQDLNSNSSTSSPSSSSPSSYTTTSSQIITGRSYIDHVYSFAGQSYDPSAESTLNALNELSTSERLCLQSRQLASRDVRILLPNKEPKHEIQNYETFLLNFNKLALACYLKVLRAPGRLWSAYDINRDQDSSTNYSNLNVANLNRDEEKNLRSAIDDEEFIKTYLDLVINAHNQVANKLYLLLNNNSNSVRVHFKAYEAHKADFSSKKVASGDTHLFRSFRVIGLRKQKSWKPSRRLGHSSTRHSNHSSSYRVGNNNYHASKSLANFLVQNDFNDVVDIRAAFDIRQFQNRTGYDCFIECEFNYFRIYHHVCNHVHLNYNSNEFNSVVTRESNHQQHPRYQQTHQPRISSRQVDDHSRRKAERLIANHCYNYSQSQHQPQAHPSSFVNFQNQQMSPRDISMRLTCNRNKQNELFFGAQYYNDSGRNNKSSFYFTKNKEDLY